MSMIAYTVMAEFTEAALAEAWLCWLRDGHIAEVLAGGATRAEIVAIDGPSRAYEIRYEFPSREVFQRYEHEFAPRLRADGLLLFPVEKGVSYRRSLGVITDVFPGAS